MYVNAPRLPHDGILTTTEGIHMNIAPSGTDHASAGYETEDEAIANALTQNTTFPSLVTRSERWDMQSGKLGHEGFRNTEYWSSYLRRSVDQRGFHLARHKTSGRYYCESAPIRLGSSDGLYTGWLDFTAEMIAPWGGELDPIAVWNRSVIENTRRRGIVECKQKMLDSKMDLAESLVDLDSTVLMIAERAWSVLKAWQHVRKKNFKAALNELGLSKTNWNPKTIGDAWLELQYGWLPLLNDVYSGVEVVKDLLGDPLQHHTYAKRRVRDGLLTKPLTGWAPEWVSQESHGDAQVEVETKFRFRIEDSLVAYIAGFQLSNPLYVFWVAMPFTFVVDWFLPIGDWLSSLTATLGLTFVDGYQTTKTFASVTATGVKRITWRHIWDEVRPVQQAKSRIEVGFMRRVVFYTWPMSYTYFKFPFSSPQRIASAIALTRSTAGLR